MRGQRLFIRPIDSADHEVVVHFLQEQSGLADVPSCGLIGKLLGKLVAVVAMEITPDAIRIDNIVVDRELRRKRIGRVMLDEVEQIAAKMDRSRLIVGESAARHEFFSRVGFESEGATWIRQVRSQSARQRVTR
jgi:N-acetylglutamate synthase-like GNAT family acetyltransferase